MNAVPFDTLRMAQRLEAAGFAAAQAAGAAEALTGADLATKGDLASVRTDLLGAIELLRQDMTIKLGGMIFIAVGVVLAAMRYMPPHP